MDINLCSPDKLIAGQMDIKLGVPDKILLDVLVLQMDKKESSSKTLT